MITNTRNFNLYTANLQTNIAGKQYIG